MQKTVDGAEWTITCEIDNGEVSGNVRGADSSTFLECDRVRVDREELLGEFQCYSTAGGTCTVLGPLEDCPLGVDPQFCFVGECQ